MIWAKTDAGRTEIQTRALVKDRARRNLLLVIDGVKPEAALLAQLAGIAPDDFTALQLQGLIAPVAAGAAGAANEPAPATGAAPPAPPSAPAAPLDYTAFTAALTQIIARDLGLRGFMLTLAVEKADSFEALHEVARRTLDQLQQRKGAAAAAAAQRTLYGG